MTVAQVTTPDGYVIRVFSSMYLDWGLEITRFGKERYYSPHALSGESYGYDREDDDGNELDEGVEWTPERWREVLLAEADDLIEGFVGVDQ